MTVQQFPASPRARALPSSFADLSREEIEVYVARGRRARSEAFAALMVGAWRGLAGLLADRPEPTPAYRVHGKARP